MFWVPFTKMAMLVPACCFRCLALLLGRKPCSSTTAITFRRVSSLTSGCWFSTRDTVATPQPDSRAISLMVIVSPPFRVSASRARRRESNQICFFGAFCRLRQNKIKYVRRRIHFAAGPRCPWPPRPGPPLRAKARGVSKALCRPLDGAALSYPGGTASPLEALFYPFTAPAATPLMMCFWHSR